MKTIALGLLTALALFSLPLPAAEPKMEQVAESEAKLIDNPETFTTATAAARIKALERENELLRKENQALRRQVVTLRTRIGSSEAEKAGADAKGKDEALDAAASKVKPDRENDEHWLTGSGRRHNSSCRYFKTGNGRLCTEKEGTPCKVCGG